MFSVGPSLTATSQQTATFFWQTVHMLTLVYASLQQPLSSFPKVAVCGEVKLYHLTKGGYSCS